jgi:hypothetical protein
LAFIVSHVAVAPAWPPVLVTMFGSESISTMLMMWMLLYLALPSIAAIGSM